mgnify:CR=1 FL=1
MVSVLKEQGWSLNEIYSLPIQLRQWHCEQIRERLEERHRNIKNATKK